MERPKPAWMAQRRMREDEQLTRIRAALARPQSYPHRPARVELRETHISWVFLAGERAYKLKKPLVLDFLDYGTRARRRLMCEREVELNRVLAPDIYLGVRGVAPAGEGIVLTSPDDPRAIEHVVEMQRFDERDTLAARLRRGALRDGQLTAVARALARFHAGAARAPAPRAPELDAELRFEREVHELAELAGEREELTRLLALARFADAFIAARGETIAARAASGSVRDGHGDLRAEHVLLDGRIRIVDRIEFDSALRALDVGDDLAFLHFDLAAAGAWHLAELLLRRYREAGGDPGEDWLIAFYAARHALIRAKVALVRATQQRKDHAAAERARRLITLAERFAWRARLPLAIILAGLPASGKSHLARELAHRSGLAQVSSDLVRKRLAGVPATGRAPAEVYARGWSERTYAELAREAAHQLAERGGVIIDATFRRRADRAAFARTFAGAAPILLIECVAPGAVLAERAAARERDARRISDADLTVVLREQSSWEPLDEFPARSHIALRTDRPLAEIIADIESLLDARLPALIRSAG